MLFFWTLYSTNPEKCKSLHKDKASQLFSALIIISVSWAANQHIRMISEGSCDTEDWSNDNENSALHHRNKLHFKIYSYSKTIF